MCGAGTRSGCGGGCTLLWGRGCVPMCGWYLNTARCTPNARVCRSIPTVIPHGNNGTIHGVQLVALFGDPHNDWHITRESFGIIFVERTRLYHDVLLLRVGCNVRAAREVSCGHGVHFCIVIVELGSLGGMPWLASVPCLHINPLGLLL